MQSRNAWVQYPVGGYVLYVTWQPRKCPRVPLMVIIEQRAWDERGRMRATRSRNHTDMVKVADVRMGAPLRLRSCHTQSDTYVNIIGIERRLSIDLGGWRYPPRRIQWQMHCTCATGHFALWITACEDTRSRHRRCRPCRTSLPTRNAITHRSVTQRAPTRAYNALKRGSE